MRFVEKYELIFVPTCSTTRQAKNKLLLFSRGSIVLNTLYCTVYWERGKLSLIESIAKCRHV